MFRQRKRCYDVTLSRQEGRTTRHLASAQHWAGLAGGDTGRLFLTFGGPVRADRISYCPLDRVLTYKNLIYLLNLQFCKLNTYLILTRTDPPFLPSHVCFTGDQKLNEDLSTSPTDNVLCACAPITNYGVHLWNKNNF